MRASGGGRIEFRKRIPYLDMGALFIGSGLGYRISVYITPLFGARSDMVLLSLMLCIERPDIILYADIVYSNPFSGFLQNTVPLSVNILRLFHNSGVIHHLL